MMFGEAKWSVRLTLDAGYVRQINDTYTSFLSYFHNIVMTTRDASVTDVVNGRVLLVKVQDGFTQEESLSYLANCLNISEQELPEQADQIYSESKGNSIKS